MTTTKREDARFRREFVAESDSILEQAAETLATLEKEADPHPEVLNSFFRSIHSLKGLAGMVGLPGLTETAHDLEALLDRVRMGHVPLDRKTFEAVKAGLAALEQMAARVSDGDENPLPNEAIFHLLREASLDRGVEPPPPDRPIVLPEELERVLTDYERHRLLENQKKARQILLLSLDLGLDGFDVALRKGMTEAGRIGELIGTFPGPVSSPESMNFLLLVGAPSELKADEIALECGAVSFQRLDEPPVEAIPLAAPPPAQPPDVPSDRRTAGRATVRVGLDKINHVLELTGDLALARNVLKRGLDRFFQNPGDRAARTEVQKAYTQIDRSTIALGRAALATRLVPVEQMTARLTRAAQSISLTLGKKVVFEVVGGETEIDKVMADELGDPFLHLLRNALDHGIEPPEKRRSAGKPEAGRIALTAVARGREVVFTMTDDGGGMDGAAILREARDKGVLLPSDPDPSDPLEPIFRPGFSTSEGVSELSGRGVGLDVVRSNIQAMKGTVGVRSEPGKGTAFEVVVPITLALVESLLVRSGGRSFAFPTSSIVRTFRADSYRIRGEAGNQTVLDDGEPLSLVSLEVLLGIAEEKTGPSRRTVVVAEQGAHRFGFLVTDIEGMQDLIVKPLPDDVPRAHEITGTAELPDGDVALTLDTGLLLERAARLGAAASS
jgi:two-component system, chemotaxis family, sensor kinase CheA